METLDVMEVSKQRYEFWTFFIYIVLIIIGTLYEKYCCDGLRIMNTFFFLRLIDRHAVNFTNYRNIAWEKKLYPLWEFEDV